MPFGLLNAAQSFQLFMDQMLHGLPFAYDYIDDILVASANPEEHLHHLCEVCRRLDTHGIVVNPDKCDLGVPSLDFLGHRVDQHGIRPLKDKVEAIRQFPQPASQPKLRQFLGLVNFEHVHPRDALRKALQPTHDGPLKVIRRASKLFTVLVHEQEQTISLDRLKAALLDIAEDVLPAFTSTPSSKATSASTTATPASTSATPQVPVHTTHSGRRAFPRALHLLTYRSLAAHWRGSTVVYKH